MLSLYQTLTARNPGKRTRKETAKLNLKMSLQLHMLYIKQLFKKISSYLCHKGTKYTVSPINSFSIKVLKYIPTTINEHLKATPCSTYGIIFIYSFAILYLSYVEHFSQCELCFYK